MGDVISNLMANHRDSLVDQVNYEVHEDSEDKNWEDSHDVLWENYENATNRNDYWAAAGEDDDWTAELDALPLFTLPPPKVDADRPKDVYFLKKAGTTSCSG